MRASNILDQINTQATDSLNKAKEVAQAADEQVKNMENLALEFDVITKDAKVTAESMINNTTAAKSLKELANILKQHINFFKI